MTEEREQNERVETLVAAVLAVHGDRLDEGQRQILRRHIERLRQTAGSLADHRLENADEPDFASRAIEWTDAV